MSMVDRLFTIFRPENDVVEQPRVTHQKILSSYGTVVPLRGTDFAGGILPQAKAWG